jgi:hypothetical protein
MEKNIVLSCPGRNTTTHMQFLEEFTHFKDHHIFCLDTSQADLVYCSGSSKLTLCSKERYMLELHKFLLIRPACSLIKDIWEGRYGSGSDWDQRSRDLASFNSKDRGRILRNWEDVALYYCILAMSGFHYHYNKWKFVGEHNPITPDYESLTFWSEYFSLTDIKFQPRSVENFRTTAVDDNTIIYFNFPYQYGSYGCRYLWNKPRFGNTVTDLVELARMGHKVCVSTPFINRGRHLRHFTRILPESLFKQHIYHELKASKSEAFYVSGF